MKVVVLRLMLASVPEIKGSVDLALLVAIAGVMPLLWISMLSRRER